MYDELVKALRICEDGEHCDLCPKWDDKQNGGMNVCQTAICKEAADAIEELSKLNAEITKRELKLRMEKPRWIPVTERLPLYGQDVLAVRTYGDGEKCQEVLMAHIAVWDEGTGEKWWNATNITHWMPLPEPPKEE